jgi:hypothetical protein
LLGVGVAGEGGGRGEPDAAPTPNPLYANPDLKLSPTSDITNSWKVSPQEKRNTAHGVYRDLEDIEFPMEAADIARLGLPLKLYFHGGGPPFRPIPNGQPPASQVNCSAKEFLYEPGRPEADHFEGSGG